MRDINVLRERKTITGVNDSGAWSNSPRQGYKQKQKRKRKNEKDMKGIKILKVVEPTDCTLTPP